VKILKHKKNCKKIAEIGDHLDVHYVGRLNGENGKIFDESRPKGHVFKFQLGAGQVIQGYERGVPGMCKGEKRTLTVPSQLAYGDNGIGGVIPGKATLHFTVELMDIRKATLKTVHPAINIPGGGEL
jgi:FKBP-type peptidyl-prolyl cis-trans isomerase